ncbi:hypothetical protein [Plastoroseomonas arctica]|uniref:hypothetical protein n=1 Tax=Plastoroseomonas arctica TaxID=1509237 RepID=UPI001BA4D4D2|nr:hypothetical protein [Plastoroseomonas arctica]
MPTTYVGHSLAKMAGSNVISGSGDAASAISAEAKAQVLNDILQTYYQARGEEFDGREIGLTDVKRAIIYARGKKHSKAIRKGVIGTAKFGLQIAATAGGATIGSVVPVLGTALGGIGGAVAGAGLGVTVTVADRLKRSAKGIYKFARGTRGVHRLQAAATLLHCHTAQFNVASGGNPADEALAVLLGEEYGMVTRANDTERLANRLKSN